MHPSRNQRHERVRQLQNLPKEPSIIPIGVVGLGLMGTSITTCLLAAGHPVIATDRDLAKCRAARRRVLKFLAEMRKEGLFRNEPKRIIQRFKIARSYSLLKDCEVVLECIYENVKAKRKVIRQIEKVVHPSAIIGSNTSGTPITDLQAGARHPGRILGIHWAEPAHITRFMEIICGDKSDHLSAQRIQILSRRWGKEASILCRDIRGFISNRCMYALLREAFYLVESGYATVADVDRSLRNDLGYWITFCGPFRFMDLTGIPAYESVMRDLLPELSRSTKVPDTIHRIVKAGGRGTANNIGFYPYTPSEARRWEEGFIRFSYDIRALAQEYPEKSAMIERSRPAQRRVSVRRGPY